MNSISDAFINFNRFSLKEQKELAQEYREEFLDFIAENEKELAKNTDYAILAIYIIQVIFDYDFQEKIREVVKRILPLINKITFKAFETKCINVIKQLFFSLSAHGEFKDAFEVFTHLASFANPSNFSIIHAYLMYYSYQTKDYSQVEIFLNNFISFAEISNLKINVEFALFYFFKGKIHLRLKAYEKALSSFCACVQTCVANKFTIITSLQFEAIHHIILLNYMPCLSKYQRIIQPIFNYLEKLSSLKEIKIYYKLIRDNGKSLSNWITDNNIILKQDKTLGLAQIILKEIEIMELMTVLRKYKRITLSSLAMVSKMKEQTIQNHLKTVFLRNELNLKYDEVDNIIEILPTDYSNSNIFEELKKSYGNMIYSTNNISTSIRMATKYLIDQNEKIMIERAIQEADKKEIGSFNMMHSSKRRDEEEFLRSHQSHHNKQNNDDSL